MLSSTQSITAFLIRLSVRIIQAGVNGQKQDGFRKIPIRFRKNQGLSTDGGLHSAPNAAPTTLSMADHRIAMAAASSLQTARASGHRCFSILSLLTTPSGFSEEMAEGISTELRTGSKETWLHNTDTAKSRPLNKISGCFRIAVKQAGSFFLLFLLFVFPDYRYVPRKV